ncbi:hypothetical protein [Methylotenera sp.]|uniref:hypothetical protein n=1 Tax=Methylotenera sp. TaxID=2051956 RepID=UPI002ED8D51A
MLKLLFHAFVFSLMSLGFTAIQAAPNDDFGRLFSKPAEREKLDKLRQSQQLKVATPQEAAQESDAEQLPADTSAPITMQGYVKRSDGVKGTLWINNQAVQEGGAVDNVQVGRINRRGFSTKATNTEGVDVQASGKKIRLKAGQVYEPETSQIKELQVVEKAKRLRLDEAGVIGGDE